MRKIALIGAALAVGSVAAAPTQTNAIAPKAAKPKWRTDPRLPYGFVPANINRNTGRPHEHKREIARRQRQAGAL